MSRAIGLLAFAIAENEGREGGDAKGGIHQQFAMYAEKTSDH